MSCVVVLCLFVCLFVFCFLKQWPILTQRNHQDLESLDHCADNHYRKRASTVEIVSIWWCRLMMNYFNIDALPYTFSGAFGNHHCRDYFERGVFLILNNNWVYVTWGNGSQRLIQFLWLRPVTHRGFGLRHPTFIEWSLTEIQWWNTKRVRRLDYPDYFSHYITEQVN